MLDPAAPAADEAARRAALASYRVMDTPPEERFDALVRLAAQLTGSPIALVSLLDGTRQWFKARVGLELQETPQTMAFCAHALPRPQEVLVVPDTEQDARFAGNPLVTGDPGIRFYAGAPLVGAEGQPLGTLCVMDTRPRELPPEQLEGLATLADQVVAQLELRRQELGRRSPSGEDEVPRAELVRAVEQGELVVHFQPLWDVQVDGRALAVELSGAEALVRWQHPERGLLPPADFVPAMERQGLATLLGEEVLRQSLTVLARWERRGLLSPSFRLHVNLAAQQLHEGGVLDLVDDLAARTGVALTRLCLEVTESALLDADAFSPAEADRIVGRGVRLVLDDFGTGHASLTQLRSWPFAGVKVDRSFVAGLGVDPQDQVIVDTVVSMSHRLGVEPVCEGVETPQQLDHVVQSGCRTVQGWLFGRAEPAGHWEHQLFDAPRQVLLHAHAPALRLPGARRVVSPRDARSATRR